MTATGDRDACRSCGARSLVPILDWPALPVNAALFPSTEGESLAIPRASFRLVACDVCGLVFNADHDDDLVEYSPRCVETQACSPTSRAFTDELAREWIERHGLVGEDVVEVGCGPEATFLRTICGLTGGRGIGVDPSCTAGTDGVVTLIADRFRPVHTTLPGRALVCRHTLEHIGDVAPFLRLLAAWAERRVGAPVLIEVPDAGRIFRDGAFWDVYYEHCSYFTAASLEEALRRAGLSATRMRSGFDGQYLLVDAEQGAAAEHDSRSIGSTVEGARAFGRLATERIARAHDALRALAETGPVLLWQAGGKALAVLTLSDVADAVVGVVDGNPAKRGLYLPGTSRSILGPQDVAALEPRHVVVMNAIYVDEVARALSDVGVAADVCAFESLVA
jgi:hypothetical protein